MTFFDCHKLGVGWVEAGVLQRALQCPGQPSPATAYLVHGVDDALLKKSGLKEKSPEVAL